MVFLPNNATVGVAITIMILVVNQVQSFSAINKESMIKRTIMKKDVKKPDILPVEVHEAALNLLQNKGLYRYGVKEAQDSIVSQCELEISQFTGHKYCIGLNSCGSALMLLLKTSGLKPGDEVISNAFTFGAVPSAIEHAGGKAVYVESTDNLVMCAHDLDTKLSAHPNCKHVLVSHIRAKLADMDAISQVCERHGAILLEDCAHALGVEWKGKHSGHVGKACAISSQSYKVLNSGEGGFFLTDDPSMAAQCAVYAGGYEKLSLKHLTVPDQEYFDGLPIQLPNYSLRMSELTASVIRPQITTLKERVSMFNDRYPMIQKKIKDVAGSYLTFPKLTPGITTPVHDSIQFNLNDSMTEEQVVLFLKECNDHGLNVEWFGHKENARNFINWGFAPATDPLPRTTKMLERACEIRFLPLSWDEEDFDDMAEVIGESFAVVFEG